MPKLIPRRFNGSSSILSYPANAAIVSGVQTVFAQVFYRGTGGGGNGYFYSDCTSTATNGCRFFVESANTRVVFGVDSSGSTLNPSNATSVGSITTGNFYTFAATHDGSVTAANVKMYYGKNGNILVEDTTTPFINGAGSINLPTGNTTNVGNRPGAARAFDGDVGVVAKWNRVLTLQDLQDAQRFGPLSVPVGLLFCWMNGVDWGPFRLNSPSLTAVDTTGISSPYYTPLVRFDEDDHFFGPGAAAVVTRSFGYIMG